MCAKFRLRQQLGLATFPDALKPYCSSNGLPTAHYSFLVVGDHRHFPQPYKNRSFYARCARTGPKIGVLSFPTFRDFKHSHTIHRVRNVDYLLDHIIVEMGEVGGLHSAKASSSDFATHFLEDTSDTP